MPSGRTNNFAESGRGLGHVTLQFLEVRSAILATAWLLVIVFDIYSLYFYFNVYLLYVAHVSYIIKRIWYGMVARCRILVLWRLWICFLWEIECVWNI